MWANNWVAIEIGFQDFLDIFADPQATQRLEIG
jgi:hypothetical protein